MTTEIRDLSAAEMDHVSGGIIAILIGMLHPSAVVEGRAPGETGSELSTVKVADKSSPTLSL